MARNRLVIRGFWGEPNPPHVSFNILADAVWRACLRRGGVRGLRRYDMDDSRGSGDDKKLPAAAIGLAYSLAFSPEANTKAAWGNASTIEELPNPFGNSIKGMMHIDAAPNAPLRTYNGVYVPENTSHTFRVSLAKAPDKGDDANAPRPVQLFYYVWANGSWRLEVRDGQARLQKLGIEYSKSNDDALDALLRKGEPTPADSVQIETLRRALFEIDESLSLPSGGNGEFHQPSTLTFLPEPRGVVRVVCEETGETNIVEVTSILKTRKIGVVWAASSTRLEVYGGVFAWQVGHPQFANVGTMRLGKFAPGFAPGEVPTRGQWDISLPGTNVTFVNESVEPDEQPPLFVTTPPQPPQVEEFVATLSGSGRTTPFLYAAECFKSAGARDGSDDVSWDSDEHLQMGTSAIMDVSPQFDGEGRRASYQVVLRCVTDRVTGENHLGDFPEVHDRICDLYINGERVLKSGFIRNVTHSKMAKVSTSTRNEFERNIAKAASGAQVILEITDPWFILDDDLMMDDPIGDGRNLGNYVRVILRGAGFRDSEMSGVGATTGRVLPQAAMGETFAVRPQTGTRRGDFLRELIEQWGMGLKLWWDNIAGTWRLAMPSTAIKAVFSSDKNTPVPYRIEEQLDIIHDYEQTYNIITVEGASDAETGENIVRQWPIWEGFRGGNNYAYIGRKRRMATVKNDGARTVGEVMWILRSMARKYGRAGRFASFTTWYIPNLFPQDRVTCDGIVGEIESIGSGGIAGRMFAGDDEIVWYGDMQPLVRLLQTGEKP